MAKIDRRTRRMMKQMGMKMNELGDIDTVILRSPIREILIEGPIVNSINVQGKKIYQVVGGRETERSPQSDSLPKEKKVDIPEEDVLLVAQQANVSIDRARTVLEETDGDLARAILILQTS